LKKIKLCVMVLITFAFLFATGFINEKDFYMDVGEDYITCYSDNVDSDFAKQLNMSKEELKDYFSENDIKFMAISSDNKSQIRVISTRDDFSKAVGNMSNLSKDEAKKLGKELISDGITTFDIYEADANKYIKISERLKDSGGEYTLTRFLTVENGTLYNISFFDSAETMTEENYKVINSFKIEKDETSQKYPWYIACLISFGIAIFVSIIVITVVLTVRDYKNKPKKS